MNMTVKRGVSRIALVLCSVALSACGGGDESQKAAAFQAFNEWPAMVRHGACGSLFVYTHDDSETHAVTVSLSDVSPEEVKAGLSLTVDLPHPAVEVELVEGEQVDDPLCNDLTGSTYRVDRTWVPTGGHLAVVGENGVVDVQRLQLQHGSGSEVVVQPFEVPIGTLGG